MANCSPSSIFQVLFLVRERVLSVKLHKEVRDQTLIGFTSDVLRVDRHAFLDDAPELHAVLATTSAGSKKKKKKKEDEEEVATIGRGYNMSNSVKKKKVVV
jgi:hypothetical protein